VSSVFRSGPEVYFCLALLGSELSPSLK